MLGLAAISVTAGSAWADEAEDLYPAMRGGKCEPATTLHGRAKARAAAAEPDIPLPANGEYANETYFERYLRGVADIDEGNCALAATLDDPRTHHITGDDKTLLVALRA
ncbi:hypothetical protein A9975_25050 [Cupriavidus sp. UME77]|nr:hypothetical protein [Cupriavidus sp. UME77]